jgi:hypothetical protein
MSSKRKGGPPAKVWRKVVKPHPSYSRIYIYDGDVPYFTNKPLEYEPYQLIKLILDFDANETLEGFLDKDTRSKIAVNNRFAGKPYNISDYYQVGIIRRDTPEYHKYLAEEKIVVNYLPPGLQVYIVYYSDEMEIIHITPNIDLAYQIAKHFETEDVREIVLPYGPVEPIPVRRSLTLAGDREKIAKYLSLYKKFSEYISGFLKNPEGSEYFTSMKSFYEGAPDKFRQQYVDDVKALELQAQRLLLESKGQPLNTISNCSLHVDIKTHTKGAYIAELSILTACYFSGIPVDGALSVWFRILGQAEVSKYIILLKDPRANKLKILLHMYDTVAIRMSNYEYCVMKNNMIANLFFTGTCNCVCGTILMEALAEYVGLKNVISVLVPRHIQNIFIDNNQIVTLESTIANTRDASIGKYIVRFPAKSDIETLLITPQTKVFGLLQTAADDYIRFKPKLPTGLCDSLIAIWKDIFGDKYPFIESYYQAVKTDISKGHPVSEEDSALVNLMKEYRWNTDNLESFLESIYIYMIIAQDSSIFYNHTFTLINNIANELKTIGEGIYQYYFIDHPAILMNAVDNPGYKYSVLSTITVHEGKDISDLIPPDYPTETSYRPPLLPPKHNRVYIYRGPDLYLSNTPIDYEPYLSDKLVIDFDENETLESFSRKWQKYLELSNLFQLDLLPNPSDRYIIGLIRRYDQEYEEKVTEEKVEVNPLPDGTQVYLVLLEGDIIYITTNKELAEQIDRFVNGEGIEDVILPSGFVKPIPDEKSLFETNDVNKLKEYLTLYEEFTEFISGFLTNPSGNEYTDFLKSMYVLYPEYFQKEIIDDVEKMRMIAYNRIHNREQSMNNVWVSSRLVQDNVLSITLE